MVMSVVSSTEWRIAAFPIVEDMGLRAPPVLEKSVGKHLRAISGGHSGSHASLVRTAHGHLRGLFEIAQE